ncbi:UNKNOWN [Stylonychia lemnae]|uniref:Uncharacterized protein n=1 Tax=Stylonychia lemnae TaxID=5949 RepID=A0A078AXJ6_STYLE|nr:UNKNOWN [Stylonychia lemnae]|eukprot:CDW85518.1 UNKNOWN [Stylonychia lemnae]
MEQKNLLIKKQNYQLHLINPPQFRENSDPDNLDDLRLEANQISAHLISQPRQINHVTKQYSTRQQERQKLRLAKILDSQRTDRIDSHKDQASKQDSNQALKDLFKNSFHEFFVKNEIFSKTYRDNNSRNIDFQNNQTSPRRGNIIQQLPNPHHNRYVYQPKINFQESPLFKKHNKYSTFQQVYASATNQSTEASSHFSNCNTHRAHQLSTQFHDPISAKSKIGIQDNLNDSQLMNQIKTPQNVLTHSIDTNNDTLKKLVQQVACHHQDMRRNSPLIAQSTFYNTQLVFIPQHRKSSKKTPYKVRNIPSVHHQRLGSFGDQQSKNMTSSLDEQEAQDLIKLHRANFSLDKESYRKKYLQKRIEIQHKEAKKILELKDSLNQNKLLLKSLDRNPRNNLQLDENYVPHTSIQKRHGTEFITEFDYKEGFRVSKMTIRNKEESKRPLIKEILCKSILKTEQQKRRSPFKKSIKFDQASPKLKDPNINLDILNLIHHESSN